MNEQLFYQMDRICHKISMMGGQRLFLYPFGYMAMDIYKFLRMRTKFEIICVDQKSGEYDSAISFDEMLSVGDWGG